MTFPRAGAPLAVVLVFGGCRADEPPEASSGRPVRSAAPISRDSAIVLARQELLRAPDASEYMPDSLLEVLPTDSSWHVMFKRTDWRRRRPGFGLIEVNRMTGRAAYVPLR